MKVNLIDSDYAHVNFANQAKVSIRAKEARAYNVRWHKAENTTSEYVEVGRMDLEGGRWGAYPARDIEQWKVEFWQGDDAIYTFENNLANKQVIVVAKPKVGKTLDFEKIKKYCSNKVNEFNCDLFVFFKNSHQFDFSDLNFRPLRMNDNIPDMHFGIEKEF